MTRILVIEDTQGVREEIVDILGFEGFDVRQAANGRLGYEAAIAEPPDLVVCDLMMPELDGYGTLAALRAHPATATVPVLFLTARADRPDMRRAMELGADDYLTKPFSTDDLLKAIAATLAKRKKVKEHAETELTTLRSDLARALPHELRTPLQCIVGYADLLCDPAGLQSFEEVAKMGGRILDAAQRLERMTENFLFYAQLHMTKDAPMRPHPTSATHDCAAVLAELATTRATARGRAADLRLDAADVGCGLVPKHFAKLVEELVDNAFKFSPADSEVDVTFAATPSGVRLTVRDRGRGMEPEQIARVGAYVQFDRGLHEQQGCGLGLGIAQGITALWGGTLAIERPEDGGTRVVVCLPAAPAADADAHA